MTSAAAMPSRTRRGRLPPPLMSQGETKAGRVNKTTRVRVIAGSSVLSASSVYEVIVELGYTSEYSLAPPPYSSSIIQRGLGNAYRHCCSEGMH